MGGTILIIAILAVVLFFALRSTIKRLKDELSGKGCSCSGGSCSGCCGCSGKPRGE